ncbi:protein that induces appearance of [PIN+] prion when overproduced [Elasticomyces elasticus]|nr:hypothetical protein LTR28_008178 [Elasticomyces elasticus]KAK4986630.1 protein that induces appearance of [PIN+] prion when overproduced [Elasticomyces elasticus]KAK4999357.1 protein that induces appearance of [PIN+] prion when overproduced [Elasticomyces elasticus]
MGDKAGITRAVNTIRTELEYLRDSGVVSEPQFQSILSQLPQPGGFPSQYVDARYSGQPFPASAISYAAQDPNHPANPHHPKHGEWAKKLGSKLGNAAIFGAGATAGSDLVNSIF